MHELSLAQQIMGQIQDTAKNEGLSSIKRVSLEVGSLALVECDALQFYFGVLSKESIADGALLEIKEIEAIGICKECGEKFALEQVYDTCSQGHQNTSMLSGMELLISELEAN